MISANKKKNFPATILRKAVSQQSKHKKTIFGRPLPLIVDILFKLCNSMQGKKINITNMKKGGSPIVVDVCGILLFFSYGLMQRGMGGDPDECLGHLAVVLMISLSYIRNKTTCWTKKPSVELVR